MNKHVQSARGPRTIYAPKVRPARCHLLTKLSNDILDAAMRRTGQNSSTLVEHLTRLYAGSLTAEEFAPVE